MFTALLAAVPVEFHISIIALALATRTGDWLLKHLDVWGAGDYSVPTSWYVLGAVMVEMATGCGIITQEPFKTGSVNQLSLHNNP